MHRFLIVIEKAGKNFPAYSHSPDLPGCVAPGKTREDAEDQMHEAIGMHIRGLHKDGLPVRNHIRLRHRAGKVVFWPGGFSSGELPRHLMQWRCRPRQDREREAQQQVLTAGKR
jgi:predicted RNase H-like HicB family nuclease